jgi:hypothetical protein
VRKAIVLSLLAVVAAPGCGHYFVGDKASPPTTKAVRVGGEVNLVDGTTTTTSTAAAAKAAATTAAGPRPSATSTIAGARTATSQASATTVRDICDGNGSSTPNVSKVDKDGVRLELVVADRLCFDESEGFTMQLRATNRGRQSVFYDSNKYDVFAVAPADGRAAPAWSESTCYPRPPGGTPGPPIELAPGETVSFVADYPRKGSPCHNLTAGDYNVTGRFRTCPEGSYPKGYCDPQKTVDLGSAPMPIRIRPGG